MRYLILMCLLARSFSSKTSTLLHSFRSRSFLTKSLLPAGPKAYSAAASCGRSAFPEWSGANANGFFHALPDVVVGAQSQGDHRVHAGVILNGQMRADTLKMGKEAAARLSSRTSGHFTGEIQGQAGRP